MGEKRSDTPAVTPRSDSAPHPGKITIDVKNHLAQRKVVGELLSRRKPRVLHVASRSYYRGKFTARVFIDGRYFEVDRSGLEQLEAGASPDDLWSIEEVKDDGDD